MAGTFTVAAILMGKKLFLEFIWKRKGISKQRLPYGAGRLRRYHGAQFLCSTLCTKTWKNRPSIFAV